MANRNVVSFGRPDEEQRFLSVHKELFDVLPNLQAANRCSISKQNAALGKVDIVISVLGHICNDDFAAIVLLCLHGFGDQALSIVRGMFERLVTARYLHLNPKEVDEFWSFHIVKLRKLGFDDLMKKLDPTGEALESFMKTKEGSIKKSLRDNWSSVDFVSMAQRVGLGDHIRHAYRASR